MSRAADSEPAEIEAQLPQPSGLTDQSARLGYQGGVVELPAAGDRVRATDRLTLARKALVTGATAGSTVPNRCSACADTGPGHPGFAQSICTSMIRDSLNPASEIEKYSSHNRRKRLS